MTPQQRAIMAKYLMLPQGGEQDQGEMALPDLGFGPMTETTRGGRQNAVLKQGPGEHDQLIRALQMASIPARVATDVAMQPVRAGEALGDAAFDPTLANVTNAGVQAALTIPTAKALKAGAGILAGGYGVAGARDMGISMIDEAQAKPDKQKKGWDAEVKKQPKNAMPDLPGLSPEENAAYQDVMGKISREEYGSGAERRGLEAQAKIYTDKAGTVGGLAAQNEAAAKKASQDEYDRSVSNAEAARDKELGRQTRFQDTETGKLFAKTGGLTPVLAGAGAGAISRAATGGGKAFYNYGLPAILGGAAGVTAINTPLAYDSFMTPPDNPEKAAYTAYGRELPPDHPRKKEWNDYAAGLPKANPVRDAAQKELYDPVKLGERLLFGTIEGAGGGLVGADLLRMPGRLSEGVAAMPGRVSAAYSSKGAAYFAAGGESGALKSGAAKGADVPIDGGQPPVNPPIAPPSNAGEVLPFRPNKTYGEETSPAMQAATIQAVEGGIHPSKINKAQLARQLSTTPTRVKDALGNLKLLGQERGTDISDPAALRALADELNKGPRANKLGTGNALWAIPGAVGVGAAAMSQQEREALARQLMN